MKAGARRIVLTGFMCAGKTTVARALAARLDCLMLDTDAVVVERTGRPVEAIFAEDGEARFRQIERKVLRDCLENAAARVIALGGGTWTLAENRALIAAYDCLTIWLDAPFALCWQRITAAVARDETARPLARNHEHALALYTSRRDAYSLAARRVQAGEEHSAEDTATEIMSIIERENF
ncbi:MAG TPA: shikimate kinase [Pyrinomonadaceae bacterium]|jgi:shikimate kinase